MHDGFDISLVVFALLAIFVVWKLRSVLGTRVDIEKRPTPVQRTAADAQADGNVVRLPGAAEHPAAGPRRAAQPIEALAPTEKGRAGLQALQAADASFDAGRFLSGAKMAYEMIIGAFAAGDRKTLDGLLSPEVLASFVSVIDQREQAGEQASTKIVSIDSVEISDAAVKDGVAQITARISAKMINFVRDRDGAVASGDPETVVSTDDLWTFARSIRSQDPTWRLIATESEQR
jgi:predicted lipid-binding transport protein (Tim44 family)